MLLCVGDPLLVSYLRIQVRPEGQSQTAHREEALLIQHHHQAAGGHVSGHVQGKYLSYF
jgi:hypothetical protein